MARGATGTHTPAPYIVAGDQAAPHSFPGELWVHPSQLLVWISRTQVAEERRLGLTPALHMDAKDERVQCQLEINFIDCVVTPLWEHCAHCFPALQPCMERVRANRAAYAALANCSNEEVAQVSTLVLSCDWELCTTAQCYTNDEACFAHA